jgi:hypothetical protein
MANKRVNVKAILADADLRRKLMVSTIQATQAREGIETSSSQADRAYYVVTEAERTAFFHLEPFRGERGQDDREKAFVHALRNTAPKIRFDVSRRDFGFVEGSVLAFRSLPWLAPVFRQFPSLTPQYGRTRSGLNTTEIERFSRQRWEVAGDHWVAFAKGGDFCRFYADNDLVFDWADDGAEYKQVVASKYGSASRFVKSESDYFKSGITWVQTTVLGINARLLENAIFGVASPTLFLDRDTEMFAVLGLMNSTTFDALARCLATRNWGATAVGSIPVPSSVAQNELIGAKAKAIHDEKAAWDQGNETSSTFRMPWLLRNRSGSLPQTLDAVLGEDAERTATIQQHYADLNDEVFRLYSIAPTTRAFIEESIGSRPVEVIWPQMEGKTTDQKRMEHVWRLLSYAVKRVIEASDDGIVPFNRSTGETPLGERVRQGLADLFADREESQLEVEIVNELKRNVKGYRKCTSLDDWLANAYFEYHASLYKSRPIFWHIASAPGTRPFAFGALVHCHRFDKNRMAKLRASYVRDTIEELRRDAGLADKEGRTDDRIELQAQLEEVQALDKKLQLIQEGHHEGPENGERDFRILTPWKEPSARPRGWTPDLDDGVKVNIAPLDRAGVLRIARVAE